MKLISVRLFCALALLLDATAAGAKPPTLEFQNSPPSSVLPGHTYTFPLLYKQSEGDPPTSLKMVIDTPSGIVTQPADIPSGDPVKGLPVVWTYTPQSSGQYQYHFEAASSTGGVARQPANGELELDSVSLVSKYIAMAVGLAVGLFFLPFVVYVAARAANKRGDPAAAARIALLIGVLASFALFWYLFLSVFGEIGVAIGAVAALAVLIVLFSRRRAI